MHNVNIGLDPKFIDSEEIVAKLYFLEQMERRFHYNPAKNIPLFERVTRSLAQLPDKFQMFALAAFANVVYLPDILLKASWIYLAKKVASRLNISVCKLFEQSHLLEVNPSGLISDFLHMNRVQGRLDTDRFPRPQSIEELARSLLVLDSSDVPDETAEREIRLIFGKQYWLVLSDNVLSGASLGSDLARCRRLIHAYGGLGAPKLIPVTQVLTSTAEENLNETDGIPSVLYFDERFRVRLNNENCVLFNSSYTLNGVIELSSWLANQKFFAEDKRLLPTIAKSGDDMALGFKGGGWTIVTPNCPTNSLPILWYEQEGIYEGPFPRIISRTSQTSGAGEQLTIKAIEVAPRLLQKLGVRE